MRRPSANTSVGVPATFTLDVNNPSTGTAWGLTITDVLPNAATAGMCDAAPTQVTAQVFQADGVTAVSAPLVEGTDFAVSVAGVYGFLRLIPSIEPNLLLWAVAAGYLISDRFAPPLAHGLQALQQRPAV